MKTSCPQKKCGSIHWVPRHNYNTSSPKACFNYEGCHITSIGASIIITGLRGGGITYAIVILRNHQSAIGNYEGTLNPKPHSTTVDDINPALPLIRNMP